MVNKFVKIPSSHNCQNLFSLNQHLYEEISSNNCHSTNWGDTLLITLYIILQIHIFDKLWVHIVPYGTVWSCMGWYGSVCSCIAIHSLIWLCMALFISLGCICLPLSSSCNFCPTFVLVCKASGLGIKPLLVEQL